MREVFRPLGWGRMWVFRTIRLYEGERWGFDNGAFKAHVDGEPWDSDAYLRRLDAAHALGTPLVSVVPDIVGGGAASLEFSLSWLDKLPAEWPRYLAVQDGMSVEDVRSVVADFGGIFVGGSRSFKKTTPQWVELANEFGLPVHYGRASHVRRLEECSAWGVSSCDSTQPLWTKTGPGNSLAAFVDWFSGRKQIVWEGALCTG